MLFIFTFSDENELHKFEYLYSKYKNLLLSKAYDVLKDYQLAEDAVSEAYIRIYKNLHKIEEPASGKTIAFVVTIARNVALTMLSAQKNRATEEFDEQLPDGTNLEETMLSNLSSEKIYALMNALDENLRNVFLFKYAYDYSNQEIASIFHISEDNVGVRLHRAKKKLAALLVKEGYPV